MDQRPTNIGHQLRELRVSRGVSTTTVAQATGITPGHVSALETGRSTNPTIGVLRLLAAYYDIPVSDLLQEEASSFSAEAIQLAREFDQMLPERRQALRQISKSLLTV